MQTAFGKLQATRQELIDRLDQAMRHAGDAYPGFIEAAVGDANRDVFSALTGLPPSLVALIDQTLRWIWYHGPSGKSDAISFALRMLDTEPGVAIDAVPARLLIWMLNDVERYCVSTEGGEELARLLRELVALHQRRLTGEVIDKKGWRQFRTRAVALTDVISDHALQRAARVIEAGAWDVATSSVVLTDVLAAYRELRIIVAGHRSGWSMEDERRAIGILQGIYDETMPQRDAGEFVAIPPIFRAREPEIAEGYESNLNAQNLAAGIAMKDVLEQLVLLVDHPSATGGEDLPA